MTQNFYTGLDGQYLSINKTARLKNKIIEEVFDGIMAIEKGSEVEKAWKWRFFGRFPVYDNETLEIFYQWMQEEIKELEQQDKVYQPMMGIMRKLFFQNETYEQEIKAGKEKMPIDTSSFEAFKKCMKDIIEQYLDKKEQHYAKARVTKANKQKV